MKKILILTVMVLALCGVAFADTDTPTATPTSTATNTPLPTATIVLSATDVGNGEWNFSYNGMQSGSDIKLYIYGTDSVTKSTKNYASTNFSENLKLKSGDYKGVIVISYVDRDGDGQTEGDTKTNTSNVVSFYSKSPRMNLLFNMPKVNENGEIVQISKLEQDTKEGSRYSISYPDADIDWTETTYFHIIPNGNIPLTVKSSLTDGYYIRLYEGGVVGGGTTLTAYNDNRASSLTTSTLVYFADTLVNTAGATAIYQWYDSVEDEFSKTLADGTSYILGIVADEVNQAGTIELKWEE